MNVLSDYTVDWQHLVVLLYGLDNIGGGVPRKEDAIEFIRSERLLTLRSEDWRPYPTQKEPSWHTDIAFARQYAVMFGFVANSQWNSWEIWRDGREWLEEVTMKCRNGRICVRRCGFWSPLFRNLMNPSYVEQPGDAQPTPRATRTTTEVGWCEQILENRLRTTSLEDLAARLSEKLGRTVPPTKPSVAFALHVWIADCL